MDNKTSESDQSSQVQLKDYEIPIGDYILDKRKILGSGGFGKIYYGYSIKFNEEAAIKLEPAYISNPILYYECKIYMALFGGIGIPKMYYYGYQGNYNVLIVELLGLSLEDYFNKCNRKFTLLTTLMLMDQMLSIIESMHNRYIIHRDIKPDNFLMGLNDKKNQVYIIDFGLAKKYKENVIDMHIPYKEGKDLIGTARYASINTHLGIEQSRRDDIEALGYILVYFMKGNLPWQGLKARNHREKYAKIKEKKMNISLDTLCQGLPDEFKTFIQYARNLKFEETPDYSYLKRLIKQICEKNKLSFDYNKFDWNLERNEDSSSNEQKEDNNKKDNENKSKNESKNEIKNDSTDSKKE